LAISLIGIVLFVVGAVLGLCWFSVIILPIFYGVPKLLYWIVRGKLKWKALFVYLTSPTIWTAVFVGAVVLLGTFWTEKKAKKVAHELHN
jgi:O-antigen/teichoic acid export membrane protein